MNGTVAPGYEKVRDAFLAAQAEDKGGAQLCIYRDGQCVADLWAGRDAAADRPYTDETLVVLMSASKGITATLAHVLAERGVIDLDAPIARYWPEFAQNGKDKITLGHVLTHSSGLVNFEADSGFVVEDMSDWYKCVGLLERMAPLWEPGTAFSYHALTYGFLIGEPIRRAMGAKRFGDVFEDVIARPLGVEMWYGLPEREEHRVAQHFLAAKAWDMAKFLARQKEQSVDYDTRLGRAMEAQALRTFPDFDVLNTRAAHAAEIPAGGGIGTAKALAKIYAASIGEVDGVRLMSRATMENARRSRIAHLKGPGDFAKLPMAEPIKRGLGYELDTALSPKLGPGSFGHSGAGGRLAFAHPESGTAVGYVCNNMMFDISQPDPRWVGWHAALREAVL